MLRQKTYALLLITIFVAISSVLAWLYVFDELPKKSPPRAKQVLNFELSIIKPDIEQTRIKYKLC